MATNLVSENLRTLDMAFAPGYLSDIWNEVLDETIEKSDDEVWSVFMSRVIESGLIISEPHNASEVLTVTFFCGRELPEEIVICLDKSNREIYEKYLIKRDFYSELRSYFHQDFLLPENYCEPIDFRIRALCDFVGMLEYIMSGKSLAHLPNAQALINLKRQKYGVEREDMLLNLPTNIAVEEVIVEITRNIVIRLARNGVTPLEIADMINQKFNPNLNSQKIPKGQLNKAKEFWHYYQIQLEKYLAPLKIRRKNPRS